jgi:hypothetical protein
VGFVLRERISDAHVGLVIAANEWKWSHLGESLAHQGVANAAARNVNVMIGDRARSERAHGIG